MISIETTAKKVQDAINDGLKKLDAKLDDVDVEILSQGGLFKKARVRLTMSGGRAEAGQDVAGKEKAREKTAPAGDKGRDKQKDKTDKAEKSKPERGEPSAERQPAEKERGNRDNRDNRENRDSRGKQDRQQRQEKPEGRKEGKPFPPRANEPKKKREENSAEITGEIVGYAEEFLKKVVALMGVDARIETKVEGRKLGIELLTDDSAVIGYRGEALDALEYLTSLVAGRGEEKYVKLRLDCNGYRAKREDSLVALARRMADKCARTGKKVALEPMSSAHRRIIHAALTDDDRVTTRSDGREPGRRVVILPKKKPQ